MSKFEKLTRSISRRTCKLGLLRRALPGLSQTATIDSENDGAIKVEEEDASVFQVSMLESRKDSFAACVQKKNEYFEMSLRYITSSESDFVQSHP